MTRWSGGTKGGLWRFVSEFLSLDLNHIYHATKMGSAGSRDYVRRRSHASSLFLPSTVHFFISHIPISPTLPCFPFLLFILKRGKSFGVARGVYMLLLFACFYSLKKKPSIFQTRKERKRVWGSFAIAEFLFIWIVKCTLFGPWLSYRWFYRYSFKCLLAIESWFSCVADWA
jgi:hypothetical protein